MLRYERRQNFHHGVTGIRYQGTHQLRRYWRSHRGILRQVLIQFLGRGTGLAWGRWGGDCLNRFGDVECFARHVSHLCGLEGWRSVPPFVVESAPSSSILQGEMCYACSAEGKYVSSILCRPYGTWWHAHPLQKTAKDGPPGPAGGPAFHNHDREKSKTPPSRKGREKGGAPRPGLNFPTFRPFESHFTHAKLLSTLFPGVPRPCLSVFWRDRAGF
jgi:hypothetical protein